MVERDRPKPLLTNEEVRSEPGCQSDFDRFDADQAATDHRRPLRHDASALRGAFANAVRGLVRGRAQMLLRARRPARTLLSVHLALVPMEILERDEVPHPARVASGPRPGPRTRATRDQQPIVPERRVPTPNGNLPARGVDPRHTCPNALEAEPRVGIPLEWLDVPVAHLSAEHPHQRRPGKEVVALFGDDRDRPFGLSGSERHRGLHPRDSVPDDHDAHGLHRTTTRPPSYSLLENAERPARSGNTGSNHIYCIS